MRVAIDEAGHHEPLPGIDLARRLILLSQVSRLADRNDAILPNRHRTVHDDAPVAIDGEDRPVRNESVYWLDGTPPVARRIRPSPGEGGTAAPLLAATPGREGWYTDGAANLNVKQSIRYDITPT
jgi:hypothetical protein